MPKVAFKDSKKVGEDEIQFVDYELELPGAIDSAKDSADYNKNVRLLVDAWKRGGVASDDTKIPWAGFADALLNERKRKRGERVDDNASVTTANFINMLETATSTVIREPIEPILAITGLFTTIRQKGLRTQLVSGVMGGAVAAGEYDEGGNPPEVSFSLNSGYQVATVGKSGIMASFTDEALRYASWDLMGMYMRLLGAALARYTEKRAIDQLRATPTIIFDNLVPADSLLGTTSGRDADGVPNGTLTADDLMDAMVHAMETGYPFDTMIINPQIYFMWVRDPVLRHFFLSGISGGVLFGSWQGNPAPLPPWSNGAVGALGESHAYPAIPSNTTSSEAVTPLSGYSNVATSAPVMPSYWGVSLRTVVSPLLPYDPETRLCDIFFIQSGSVGMRMVDEDVTRVEWRDEDKELIKVKFKQRDSFVLLNEGRGVYAFRNIKNAQNFWSGKVEWTRDASAVAEIDHSAPISM